MGAPVLPERRFVVARIERKLLAVTHRTDAIASSRTGSGGTIVGSATGSGGAGGRDGGVEIAPGKGGGIGRAMGACFFPHPATLITTSNRTVVPHTRVIVGSTILTSWVVGCCPCA